MPLPENYHFQPANVNFPYHGADRDPQGKLPTNHEMNQGRAATIFTDAIKQTRNLPQIGSIVSLNAAVSVLEQYNDSVDGGTTNSGLLSYILTAPFSDFYEAAQADRLAWIHDIHNISLPLTAETIESKRFWNDATKNAVHTLYTLMQLIRSTGNDPQSEGSDIVEPSRGILPLESEVLELQYFISDPGNRYVMSSLLHDVSTSIEQVRANALNQQSLRATTINNHIFDILDIYQHGNDAQKLQARANETVAALQAEALPPLQTRRNAIPYHNPEFLKKVIELSVYPSK